MATESDGAAAGEGEALQAVQTKEQSRIKRIREVLTYQLGLEILHKWREVRVIEEELERGRQLQALASKLIINGKGKRTACAKGLEFVYGGERATPFNGSGTTNGEEFFGRGYGSPSPGRRLTRSASCAVGAGRERPQSEPQAQYEVRPDGAMVRYGCTPVLLDARRMRCPKCHADRFRSMLGFLNHCRIHCHLTFSSQDDRLQRCGVVIDSSEVPPDYFNKHPSQLKQDMDLALIRADVLGPMSDQSKRPAIKVENGPSKGALPGSTGEQEPAPTAALPARSAPGRRNSRFYLKRTVIIGNSAKYLLNRQGKGAVELFASDGPADGAEGELPTHQWRLYVKNYKDSVAPSEAVRFFLHPSYRPNDVVDVLAPPFEVTRVGWGEFPVRVQLHFWDARNKPVEIVHLLRVLTVTSGKFVVTAEQAHDLEIDRFTCFNLGSPKTPPRGSVQLPPVLETRGRGGQQISDEDLLTMAVGDFPLVGRRGKRAIAEKYFPLGSMDDFLGLSFAEQRTAEQRRAKALCNHLMAGFPTFSKSFEDTIKWCREQGHTPASVMSLATEFEEAEVPADSLLYCRFCGVPHFPQDKFEILQKNCSFRPRKIHVSSRTPASDLLDRYDFYPESSEVYKRLKQEHLNLGHGSYAPLHLKGDQGDDGSSSWGQDGDGCSPGGSDEAVLQKAWVGEQIRAIRLPCYDPKVAGTAALTGEAMKAFVRALLLESLSEIPASRERAPGRPVFLTPLHVYRALNRSADFDFLINAYMLGGGPSKEDSPASH